VDAFNRQQLTLRAVLRLRIFVGLLNQSVHLARVSLLIKAFVGCSITTLAADEPDAKFAINHEKLRAVVFKRDEPASP